MAPHLLLLVLLVGVGVGFMGGLMGKGGSAIATPLLVAAGVPVLIALAAPLPATVPGTLLAADGYRRHGLIDRRVLGWALVAGLPATVLGALLTRWVPGSALVLVTDAVVAVLGLRMVFRPTDQLASPTDEPPRRGTIVAIGIVTGVSAGLLANSGGFLLAPLFVAVLGLKVKPAFGTSLAVAAVMAVPGTVVHMALGHIRWSVVAVFALGSIPFSGLGARLAIRTDPAKLERATGLALATMGLAFLANGFH